MEENRVEKAMRDLAGHEQRLIELFGPEIVKQPHYEKMRLQIYREVYVLIKPIARKDEKAMLLLLKGEVDRLEKAIYPNAVVRFIRSVGRSLKSIPKEDPSKGKTFKLEIRDKGQVETTVKASDDYRAKRSQKLSAAKEVVLLPKKRLRQSKGLRVK